MSSRRSALAEAPWLRALLMTVAFAFVALFLLLPLAVVFTEAFRRGIGAYLTAISEPDAVAALKLSLQVVALAVPLVLGDRTDLGSGGRSAGDCDRLGARLAHRADAATGGAAQRRRH